MVIFGRNRLRLRQRAPFPWTRSRRLSVLSAQVKNAGRLRVQAKHISQLAAGLSYYFVISLFPLLIAVAAALALVPLPNLFDQILALMAKFVPSDSMGFGPHRSERCDPAAWGKPPFCWNFVD